MTLSTKDDLGRRVVLKQPAQRIVSLSPATTENLFAIGMGKALAGVTSACDFPAPAQRLPRIGDFTHPSYEKILALRPDLIVFDSATVRATEVEALAARLHVPVFAQSSRKVADIARHLEELARLTGTTFDTRALRAALKPAVVTGRRKRVFIEVSGSPLYGVGPGSFVDDLIRVAGGENALKDGGAFPLVSRERLAAAAPELYVIALATGAKPTAPAISGIRVSRINADLLFRPTPRLAEGLTALRKALQP